MFHIFNEILKIDDSEDNLGMLIEFDLMNN